LPLTISNQPGFLYTHRIFGHSESLVSHRIPVATNVWFVSWEERTPGKPGTRCCVAASRPVWFCAKQPPMMQRAIAKPRWSSLLALPFVPFFGKLEIDAFDRLFLGSSFRATRNEVQRRHPGNAPSASDGSPCCGVRWPLRRLISLLAACWKLLSIANSDSLAIGTDFNDETNIVQCVVQLLG